MGQLLDLTVISNRDYRGHEKDVLDIESVEMISFEERTLKIQINFKHPNYISMNVLDKDKLIVVFRDTWLFIDSFDYKRLPENTRL